MATRARIGVEIQGLDELRAKLLALADAATGALADAVEAGAGVLRDEMISRGPGPAIEVELRYKGGGRVIYNVGPDKAHFYYAFFETGTKAHTVRPRTKGSLHWGDVFAARSRPGAMAAKPFMRPGVDEGQERIAAAVGEVLKQAVEQI